MLQYILLGVGVIILIFLLVLLITGITYAVRIAIHSLIGFLALFLTQALFVPSLVINAASVLLCAAFGIVGYAIVLVLHFAGIYL